MSNPLNIYSAHIDPAGVLAVLRRHGDVEADGDDDSWSRATLTWKAGLLKKHKLVVAHDREHYAGDGWRKHILGMKGFFSRFGPSPAVSEALARLGQLRFSLAFPSTMFDLGGGDEKLPVVLDIAEHLDGVLFTPPGLLINADFKILIDPDGEAEEGARWPDSLPALASALGGDNDDEEQDEQDEVYDPPDAQRVLRRAMVLAACCANALGVLDDAMSDQEAREFRAEIWDWLKNADLVDEVEPHERDLFNDEIEKTQQQWLNAWWRIEGLGVLAWALQLHEPLRYDELVVPAELTKAVGFQEQKEDVDKMVRAASLRTSEELSGEREHLLALHWRLRDFSLRPTTMDFVGFSKDCWFGSFDVTRFDLVDGDLALTKESLVEVDDETLSLCSSLAMERHHAINWLTGWHPTYSMVETPT